MSGDIKRAKPTWLRRLFVPCCLVLAGISAAALFVTTNIPQSGPVPVGASYLGRFSGAMWQQTPGQGFLLTNYATKFLRVGVLSFQVREGAKWSKHACFGPLIQLSPCGTARLTIDFASQSCAPTTDTWRVELLVAQRLSGAEALMQGIRQFPTVLEGVLLGVLPPSHLIQQFGVTRYGHTRSMFTPELQAYQFDQTPDHEAFIGH